MTRAVSVHDSAPQLPMLPVVPWLGTNVSDRAVDAPGASVVVGWVQE